MAGLPYYIISLGTLKSRDKINYLYIWYPHDIKEIIPIQIKGCAVYVMVTVYTPKEKCRVRCLPTRRRIPMFKYLYIRSNLLYYVY